MRRSWARVAPRVRSRAPSRIRWKRLVARAPTSTSAPAPSVKSAMNRMASTTRSIRRSRVSCTVDRSTLVTLGSRSAMPALDPAPLGGALDPGERHQRLRRRFERARREHDEEVGLEPRPVHFPQSRDAGRERHALHVPHDLVADPDAELAGQSRSTEISAARAPGVHHRPATSRSDATSVVAVGRAVLAAERPAVPGRLAVVRAGGVGQRSRHRPPFDRWMRIGTMAPAGRAVSRRLASVALDRRELVRLDVEEHQVGPRRPAGQPELCGAGCTAPGTGCPTGRRRSRWRARRSTVWFAGRCRLAMPCRHT